MSPHLDPLLEELRDAQLALSRSELLRQVAEQECDRLRRELARGAPRGWRGVLEELVWRARGALLKRGP